MSAVELAHVRTFQLVSLDDDCSLLLREVADHLDELSEDREDAAILVALGTWRDQDGTFCLAYTVAEA